LPHRQWKIDRRCGAWNVNSPYRSGSLKKVERELASYKSDLVIVQEVIWDKGGMEPADNYALFM